MLELAALFYVQLVIVIAQQAEELVANGPPNPDPVLISDVDDSDEGN